MKPSPATIAAFVASDFLKARPSLDAQTLRDELAHRIETELRGAIREERERCAALCDARREGRARSDEAAYIADAVQARRR